MAQRLLAQSGVDPLPAAPLFSRLILEDPLIPAIILIIAAVAVFFIFNAQGKVKKAILLSTLGLALSVGVLILAGAIETDREKIIAATTPLVRATAAGDSSRLDPLLDDQVRLHNDRNLAADELPQGQAWNKDQILNQVRSYLGERWRLKEAAILEVQGIIDSPGRGRTQIRIRATPEITEFPMFSWWRIDWKLSPTGQWRVIGIQPLDVGPPLGRR